MAPGGGQWAPALEVATTQVDQRSEQALAPAAEGGDLIASEAAARQDIVVQAAVYPRLVQDDAALVADLATPFEWIAIIGRPADITRTRWGARVLSPYAVQPDGHQIGSASDLDRRGGTTLRS